MRRPVTAPMSAWTEDGGVGCVVRFDQTLVTGRLRLPTSEITAVVRPNPSLTRMVDACQSRSTNENRAHFSSATCSAFNARGLPHSLPVRSGIGPRRSSCRGIPRSIPRPVTELLDWRSGERTPHDGVSNAVQRVGNVGFCANFCSGEGIWSVRCWAQGWACR